MGYRPAPPPFCYKDKGNMAAIGRNFAVMEAGRVRLSGRLAFYAWAVIHIFFLVSLHNRYWFFFAGCGLISRTNAWPG